MIRAGYLAMGMAIELDKLLPETTGATSR